ncbi:MAG: FHA domain-containing protein [Chitinispirillaceae bacterium]|jgi:predicted component of type VI protein secretion system|nr:FHA domain-containing protein [Chitinispirillaceae bacterium]
MAQFKIFYDGKLQNTYVLDEPVITIGRLPENTIAIPSMGVSRRHVRIEEDADRKLVLTDLHSLNGTLVNGKREKKVPLKSGDAITIGQFTIVYVEGNDPAAVVPVPPRVASRPLAAEEPRGQTRTGLATGPVLIDTARHLTYILDKPYMTIGSGPADDIPSVGFMIGEQQAFIEQDSDGWHVATTKVMSKLRVNGQATKTHRLCHKDRIDIGTASFRFMEHG